MAHTVANEQLFRFRTSSRHGAHFEIPGLGGSAIDIANKLKFHLLDGGTCAVIAEDTVGSSYPACGLMPGTVPELAMRDARMVEYSIRLSLINLSPSPAEMVVHYTVGEVVAYLMSLGGSVYAYGSGNKTGEAAAYLNDAGGNIYTIDSSIAEDDRQSYLVDPDTNLVLI